MVSPKAAETARHTLLWGPSICLILWSSCSVCHPGVEHILCSIVADRRSILLQVPSWLGLHRTSSSGRSYLVQPAYHVWIGPQRGPLGAPVGGAPQLRAWAAPDELQSAQASGRRQASAPSEGFLPNTRVQNDSPRALDSTVSIFLVRRGALIAPTTTSTICPSSAKTVVGNERT